MSVMSFDPEDKDSWYFGELNRDQANQLIQAEKENGVFLVRDSQTIIGDRVLCVKENDKISHYIINKIDNGGVTRFKIGDQDFPNLQALLRFYQHHFLDQSNLVRPVSQRVVAKYDFGGRDPEDLPFKKGEILTIVRKEEEEWWLARNSSGKEGLIPVPYIDKYTSLSRVQPVTRRTPDPPQPQQQKPPEYQAPDVPKLQKSLPAFARVIKAKYPTPHDPSQLRLQVGDMVKVLKTNISGEWEGEIDGKRGFFPFTHVEFVDTEADEG